MHHPFGLHVFRSNNFRLTQHLSLKNYDFSKCWKEYYGCIVKAQTGDNLENLRSVPTDCPQDLKQNHFGSDSQRYLGTPNYHYMALISVGTNT